MEIGGNSEKGHGEPTSERQTRQERTDSPPAAIHQKTIEASPTGALSEIQNLDRQHEVSTLFSRTIRALTYGSLREETIEPILFGEHGEDITTILTSQLRKTNDFFRQLQTLYPEFSREHWKQALEIAKCYLDNPHLRVPDKVVTRGQFYEGLFKQGEKPLVIFQSTYHYLNYGTEDEYLLSPTLVEETKRDIKKGKFRSTRDELPLERPDIYIEMITNDIDKPGWADTIRRTQVKGFDNLLLGANSKIDPDISVELEGTGDVFILTGATIGAQAITIHTREDINQYPGSIFSPREVDCNNYYYLGGKINPKGKLSRQGYQSASRIKCATFIYGEGVEELDPALVHIEGDVDYVQRESEHQKTISAHKMAVDSDATGELIFEEQYHPLEKETAEGEIRQTYLIDLDEFPIFFSKAITEGWRVTIARQTDKGMDVTLSKEASEEQ